MSTSESAGGRSPLLPAPSYTVHDKQREAIQSDARYKVLEWGRRGGKNVVSVIEEMEYGRAPWESRWGSDNPENTLVWWVARSYDQAEKYGFLPMLSALPDSWIESVSRSEPYEIELANGVRYEFRTYDHPETLQGAGVDRMLVDEADYMQDTLWYDDLEPMLMDTMGAAMFISKPVRPNSYFQRLAERGRSSDWPEYYYSHATSADNPFIAENPMEKRGTMPDHKFRQQYLAELPDDGGQVFKHLGDRLFTGDFDIHGEILEGVGELVRDPEECVEPFSVGVDLARHRDYRVTGAIDARGELAYYSRSQNEGWDSIQAHIEDVHATYPGVVVPDATQDNKLISDLQAAGVNLEPTKFSPQNKVELIENLITAVENREITLPDDPRLDTVRSELRMLQREVTPSGYTKYHAPGGGHDDTVDMLALAYSGIGSGSIPTASANVDDRDDDRRAFEESPIGQAVSQYQRRHNR